MVGVVAGRVKARHQSQELPVWVEWDSLAGRSWVVGVGAGPMRVVEADSQRYEDRPLPAERIRRSWEAGKGAAMGPVVGEVASGEWRRVVRLVVGVGVVRAD